MLLEEQVKSDYFEWMYDLVCEGRFSGSVTYRELLTFLHDIEFTYFIRYDENRAVDGITLRYRYCQLHDCEDLEYCLTGPCSVLEMMVALAIRCEGIMDDPMRGDRTSQWFWEMISNLGLGSMSDDNFSEWTVHDVVARFLNRDYEPDGRGGLFRVRGTRRDMRDIEIWHQLLAYLNTID